MINYKDITSVNLITENDIQKIHKYSNPYTSYLDNQDPEQGYMPLFQRSSLFVSKKFAKQFKNSTNKILIHDSRDIKIESTEDRHYSLDTTMSYYSYSHYNYPTNVMVRPTTETSHMYWIDDLGAAVDVHLFEVSIIPNDGYTKIEKLLMRVTDQYQKIDQNKTIDIFVSLKEPDALVESDLFVQQQAYKDYYDPWSLSIKTVRAKIPIAEEVLLRMLRTLGKQKIRIHLDIFEPIVHNTIELRGIIDKKLS